MSSTAGSNVPAIARELDSVAGNRTPSSSPNATALRLRTAGALRDATPRPRPAPPTRPEFHVTASIADVSIGRSDDQRPRVGCDRGRSPADDGAECVHAHTHARIPHPTADYASGVLMRWRQIEPRQPAGLVAHSGPVTRRRCISVRPETRRAFFGFYHRGHAQALSHELASQSLGDFSIEQACSWSGCLMLSDLADNNAECRRRNRCASRTGSLVFLRLKRLSIDPILAPGKPDQQHRQGHQRARAAR